jgi:type IV pilus biogenesis protein CpaD/CtpE
MTDANTPEESSARTEAVQAVVDRVSAWQHSATDGTVTEELRQGLQEAGVDLADSEVASLAEAIEADSGPVDASQVLA